MGLFNSYLKEGPGVDKNAKRRKGIFLYFEIIFAKFFKFIKTNSLYSLVSLPYYALAFFVLAPFVMRGLGIESAMQELSQEDSMDVNTMQMVIQSMFMVLIVNLFGSGPASASYAYITRCFTRAEHAGILSDGKDKFKENLKNSFLLLAADVVIILLSTNAVYFYRQFAASQSGMMAALMSLVRYFIVVLMFTYVMMHIYTYQIMVTYECNFRTLLKNSFVMAMAKLPMNILLMVVTGAVMVIPMMYLNPVICILFYMIVGMMFARYPFEFYSARVIERNIKAVEKKNKNRNTSAESAEEKPEVIFEDVH